MELEADIYTVFTGWGPKDTADMDFDELHSWHQVAIKRHNASQQG
ncbi:putative tail protein [Aeromonas phage AhyVDH1]|nr:putative tail protein [Aeromonas phage AhyVDH1]